MPVPHRRAGGPFAAWPAVLDVRLPDGDGVSVCREMERRTQAAAYAARVFEDRGPRQQLR